VSGRQKAKICSDFCHPADAEPTCAAVKTPSSHVGAPTHADATRGRTALRSVRELVGDLRSENHNLNLDRFQGCRSPFGMDPQRVSVGTTTKNDRTVDCRSRRRSPVRPAIAVTV